MTTKGDRLITLENACTPETEGTIGELKKHLKVKDEENEALKKWQVDYSSLASGKNHL